MQYYYLIIEENKSCTKGFIALNEEEAKYTVKRLQKEHEPRKWFIVQVKATGVTFRDIQ